MSSSSSTREQSASAFSGKKDCSATAKLLPGRDGLSIREELQREGLPISVIVISGTGEIADGKRWPWLAKLTRSLRG